MIDLLTRLSATMLGVLIGSWILSRLFPPPEFFRQRLLKQRISLAETDIRSLWRRYSWIDGIPIGVGVGLGPPAVDYLLPILGLHSYWFRLVLIMIVCSFLGVTIQFLAVQGVWRYTMTKREV